MANITAADVNKLRQMTGAGMMDCKQALVESDGDFEKAIDHLRKKGQKLATKRADREANEGFVVAKVNASGNFAAVIMLNCETDFVAKNEDFINFAHKVTDLCISSQPKSLEELNSLHIDGRTVADSTTDLVGKIGEKLALAHYEFIEAPTVAAYNHHGNRLATIVGLNKSGIDGIEQVGKEIGMQIAAMSPVAIDKDDVSKETIEREIEIGKEQARQEGKPEEMLEKIAMGKLNKFYKDSTLLNQEFIKDANMTVKQYLSQFNKELTVTAFRRLALGA